MLAERRREQSEHLLRTARRVYRLQVRPRASASDPRPVVSIRSQAGSAEMQGQHGSHRNKSRSGEKMAIPEAEKAEKMSKKVQLVFGREPTFYIGGGNGVALVEGPLTELGWKRIADKADESYTMKWVECKNTINYNSFKEGEQLVNHIPNCNLLTNKMGLLTSLQGYERTNASRKRRETRIKLADFIPETYRLDNQRERDAFLEKFKENDIWICKPTGMNQGKGIYLVRHLEEFQAVLQERDERLHHPRRTHRPSMGRIIQRYITDPMLLDRRKFDIRAYMLVGSTVPYLVLYHKGYIRLSLVDYDVAVDDLTAHLTNQYIQKRDPNYKDSKESTAWSMDKFNDYVNEHIAPEKELEPNWVYNTLTTRMKQIMAYCFHAVKNRLHCKVGYFDLYGLDFMVDSNMKVYLIEVNVNPSLATNCEALMEVIPGVVRETLHLTLECYDKSRKGEPLLPLRSLHNFDIIHNGCTRPRDRASTAGAGRSRPGAHSPARGQRSPGKNATPAAVQAPLKAPRARVRALAGVSPKATVTAAATAHVLKPPVVSSAYRRQGVVTLPPLAAVALLDPEREQEGEQAAGDNSDTDGRGIKDGDAGVGVEGDTGGGAGMTGADGPDSGPNPTVGEQPGSGGGDAGGSLEVERSAADGSAGDTRTSGPGRSGSETVNLKGQGQGHRILDAKLIVNAKPKVLVSKARSTFSTQRAGRGQRSPERGN